MDENVKDVPHRLRDAAQLFEERNAAYGSNYHIMGVVMSAMYPGGLFIHGAEHWTRLMLQVHRVTKETRYACNFQRGGHADSLEDLAVYAIMAAETDAMAQQPMPMPIPEPHLAPFSMVIDNGEGVHVSSAKTVPIAETVVAPPHIPTELWHSDPAMRRDWDGTSHSPASIPIDEYRSKEWAVPGAVLGKGAAE